MVATETAVPSVNDQIYRLITGITKFERDSGLSMNGPEIPPILLIMPPEFETDIRINGRTSEGESKLRVIEATVTLVRGSVEIVLPFNATNKQRRDAFTSYIVGMLTRSDQHDHSRCLERYGQPAKAEPERVPVNIWNETMQKLKDFSHPLANSVFAHRVTAFDSKRSGVAS